MTIETASALKKAERLIERLREEGANGSVEIHMERGQPKSVEYRGVISLKDDVGKTATF